MSVVHLRKIKNSFNQELEYNGLTIIRQDISDGLQRHAIAVSLANGNTGEFDSRAVVDCLMRTLNTKGTREVVNPNVGLSDEENNLIFTIYTK